MKKSKADSIPRLKIISFIIVSLVITMSAGCKKEKKEEEKTRIKNSDIDKYVYASVLNMREKPAVKSKLLAALPHGSGVTILKTGQKIEKIAGVPGSWTEVKYKNYRGWVFGGFLTATKPAKNINSFNEYHLGFSDRNILFTKEMAAQYKIKTITEYSKEEQKKIFKTDYNKKGQVVKKISYGAKKPQARDIQYDKKGRVIRIGKKKIAKLILDENNCIHGKYDSSFCFDSNGRMIRFDGGGPGFGEMWQYNNYYQLVKHSSSTDYAPIETSYYYKQNRLLRTKTVSKRSLSERIAWSCETEYSYSGELPDSKKSDCGNEKKLKNKKIILYRYTFLTQRGLYNKPLINIGAEPLPR
ncbi:MAG: SH3 domain-containing protein [bacterium]|nr:SH3 domain-containing protein [bacterium]